MLLPCVTVPLAVLTDKEKSNVDDTQLPDEQVPEEQYVPVADRDTAGLLDVVPQLFESVQVLVCVNVVPQSLDEVAGDQLVQLQLSVHDA